MSQTTKYILMSGQTSKGSMYTDTLKLSSSINTKDFSKNKEIVEQIGNDIITKLFIDIDKPADNLLEHINNISSVLGAEHFFATKSKTEEKYHFIFPIAVDKVSFENAKYNIHCSGFLPIDMNCRGLRVPFVGKKGDVNKAYIPVSCDDLKTPLKKYNILDYMVSYVKDIPVLEINRYDASASNVSNDHRTDFQAGRNQRSELRHRP